MKRVELQFDFKSTKEDPLLFTNPEKIYETYKLSEVNDILSTIEKKVRQGYYAAGYISYEATYAYYHNNKPPKHKQRMPLVWFGIFKQPTKLVKRKTGSYTIGNWKIQVTEATYRKNIQQILRTIEEGKLEQINYTVPFQANFTGNAYAYYEQLKLMQDTNFSAFLQLGDFEIASISPELFFQVLDSTVTVRPMKGTIHRGKTYEEDQRLKQWLQNSKKNRLENEIITDLMKDELADIATDIKVTEQYTIEKYATVYQMTSTIKGTLKKEITALQVLKTIFPCGSISGVPKKDSIEIISQLESAPREVYTGAIGYITPDGNATFNVPIRTVIIDKFNKTAHYHAGGAITKQSNADEEYKEVQTKTDVLKNNHPPFRLLETFGLYDGEYIVFEEHCNRLRESALYFDYHIDMNKIQRILQLIADHYSFGTWRVRLLVHQNGKLETEVLPLPKANCSKVVLAKTPMDTQNIFLYHKTTNRMMYEAQKNGYKTDVLDVLLWNENEEVTEFTIGNVVVELNGELLTPPVSSGLLPGTFREKLLREGKITERTITIQDLSSCTSIWLINSVRKWVNVDLIK